MWALVPLKGFSSAKQRLAGVLTDTERERLAQAMVADVLAVLAGHPALSGVVLVADDPAAEWLARYYEVSLLRESELGAEGLNAVLTAALERLGNQGLSEVLVLHGDLPLLAASDVDALVQCHREAPADTAVGVPDRVGTGTNALILRLPLAWPLGFGAHSWQRHRRAAAAAGQRLRAAVAPGMAFDIDLPRDLLQLMQAQGPGPAANTRRVLAAAEVKTRLGLIESVSANTEINGSKDDVGF